MIFILLYHISAKVTIKFDKIDFMNILDELTEKLEIMSKDFMLLLDANKKLQDELDKMKNKNDIFEKSVQDISLTINNILEKDGMI